MKLENKAHVPGVLVRNGLEKEPIYWRPGGAPHEKSPEAQLEVRGYTSSFEKLAQKQQDKSQEG